MSDLIERETVLAFVRRCKDRLKGKGLTYEILVDYIESIPSAERKGEWIWSDTDEFICSACGNGYRNQPTCMGKPMFEYCPFCGAKNMKGAEDE